MISQTNKKQTNKEHRICVHNAAKYFSNGNIIHAQCTQLLQEATYTALGVLCRAFIVQ